MKEGYYADQDIIKNLILKIAAMYKQLNQRLESFEGMPEQLVKINQSLEDVLYGTVVGGEDSPVTPEEPSEPEKPSEQEKPKPNLSEEDIKYRYQPIADFLGLDSVYDLTEAEREKLVPVDTIGRYYEDPNGFTNPADVEEYNKVADQEITENFKQGFISLFPDLAEKQKKQLKEHTKIVPVWFVCAKDPDTKKVVISQEAKLMINSSLLYRYTNTPRIYDGFEHLPDDVKDKIRRSISDRGCSWDNLMSWLPGVVYGLNFIDENGGGSWFDFIDKEVKPLKRYFEVICQGELQALDAMPMNRYSPIKEGEYSVNELVCSPLHSDGTFSNTVYDFTSHRSIGVFNIIAYMFMYYCQANNIELRSGWLPEV